MSKLEDWKDASREDRQWIDIDVSDTKKYLVAAREHVVTVKKILRRIEDPKLVDRYEHELECAIADVAGYEKDLDELRQVQQSWDAKYMEET